MKLLHSKILGEGKPLLILHGFLGMSDNWKTLGKQFSESGYEVHLIDQRNHGRSFHDVVFNYEALVADLNNYINHYQLATVALLGHSMGGKTAMEFACTYPEKVNKLIVADIAPKFYPEHHQTILKGLQSIDFSIVNSRQMADEKLGEYIKEFGIRQFLLKNLYWEEKGKLNFRFNLAALVNNISSIGKALDNDKSFEKPTLFIKGANSGYITVDDEPLIASHFPIAEIQSIPKAGHWLHAENPSLFKEVTLHFLSQ